MSPPPLQFSAVNSRRRRDNGHAIALSAQTLTAEELVGGSQGPAQWMTWKWTSMEGPR